MDARLKMSGMTDFFHHPRRLVAGIHPNEIGTWIPAKSKRA
ncbi:MAG: hypothetical protein ACERKU_04465 [Nitrospirota bacterium]